MLMSLTQVTPKWILSQLCCAERGSAAITFYDNKSERNERRRLVQHVCMLGSNSERWKCHRAQATRGDILGAVQLFDCTTLTVCTNLVFYVTSVSTAAAIICAKWAKT